MTGSGGLDRRWAVWVAMLHVLLVSPLVWAQSSPPMGGNDCAPRVLSMSAARAQASTEDPKQASTARPNGASAASARPTHGWVPVVLPDVWTHRWPDHGGTVWYRIDWERGCEASAVGAQPLAVGLSGMSMAGEVFVNDELLWRDASLVEPLSRSWNMPRFLMLPESALHTGVNTVWVRVVGLAGLSPGLGLLQLGPAQEVVQRYDSNFWRQRLVFLISVGLSGAVGCLFLVVWCLRRAERSYGWYAAMSLCWVAYVTTLLLTKPWPLPDTLAMSRVNAVAFVLYVSCFCLFTFRFGQQGLARTEKVLWVLTSLAVAAVLLVPDASAGAAIGGVWMGFVMVFFANCVQFQWHALRTRDPEHVLLALCWLFLLVVGVHDTAVILAMWQSHETWSAVTGPVATVFMSLLLGRRLVRNTQRIERFNHELGDAVQQARAELAQVLAREHAQALRHAKLQERMDISHELHDGLGGSLVRSMALVEQARQPLANDRVLSLFKVLRDDLRQVIDHGSSAGAVVPDTPVQWAAPLRHRFTLILDEMGVRSHWCVAPQWKNRPSALQCLGLTRLVEEALSNAIKHSRAQLLQVQCTQPQQDTWMVRIEDDGVGFDVDAVRRAGMSVGMRSMTARAERMGATLQVESAPGRTVVGVLLLLK